MTQQPQRPTEVLGALPHRRPSRRSEKRGASGAPPGERASGKRAAPPLTDASPLRDTPPAPRGMRPAPRPMRGDRSDASPLRDTPSDPSPPRGREIVGTMVQAAAELAEIGLSVSARAVREAVARLPRP